MYKYVNSSKISNKQIHQTDNEIGRMVYELDKLSLEEIKIVEDSVK